jgi:hypothetical protein
MRKIELYKPDSRFAIERFDSPRADLGACYFVRDAAWITDSEIRQGKRSPTEFCAKASAGQVETMPHESNFCGWPELRERVNRAA